MSTTRHDVDTTLTAWADTLVAQAEADGRVQGRADRQAEVDDLAARLAAVQAEHAAHMATHEPDPFGQLRIDTDAEIRGHLHVPADAELVRWDAVARPGDMLGAVLDRLTARQLLVLPERDEPYLLDATDGFYASGVASVQLADGTRQSVKSKAGRWFSLARAKLGIVGCGPRARIAVASTAWRSPAQPRPTGAKAVGRFWWGTTGDRGHELVGAQEKLIECPALDGYFGNFVLDPGPDLGGIAYHALTLKGGTTERITGPGSWRGFAGIPNGETAMVSYSGARYRVIGLDADGKGCGTSPLMVNNSPGGTVDHARFTDAHAGMPTIWRSSGEHVWSDVDTSDVHGHGVNLEDCADGFVFRWHRGRNDPGAFHVGLNARGSATIELVDVALADLVVRNGVAMASGTLQVQGYGQSRANRDRITITATRGGQDMPVKFYT
ncbi:hypothetical protein [Nocardioides marmoraquaticus]